MKANYHTHCDLCGHADGTIEEYILEAIKNNYRILGMSDHIPYPGDDLGNCMLYSDLDYYIEETNRLKDKYSSQIKLHLGLESEYLPDYRCYYEDMLNKRGVEYLILGAHFFYCGGRMANSFGDLFDTSDYITYSNTIVEGMATGLYKCIAHPDLIMYNDFPRNDDVLRSWDILIDAAVKNDYIFEFNVNGLRRGIKSFIDGERYPYPVMEFWQKVAESRIKVIIGSDCHSPELLNDEYVKEAERLCGVLGLNRIEKLNI